MCAVKFYIESKPEITLMIGATPVKKVTWLAAEDMKDWFFNNLIFQPPQRNIAFGQKITGAAGGVYKNAVFDTNRKGILRHISAEKGLK